MTLPTNKSRRQFIKRAAGAIGVGALGIVQAQETFQGRLSRDKNIRLDAAEPDSLKHAYLIDPHVIYLNHGSIGTIPRLVLDTRYEYLKQCETNPWLYIWGGAWDDLLEGVRSRTSAFIGSSTDELALTHNTTEGFNLLASGLPLGPDDEVLFSSLNHSGASQCWHHHSRAKGYSVKTFEFPIHQTPHLNDDDVVALYEEHINEKTRVLVFPHIDNTVGYRHPVQKLAQRAHELGVEFVAADGAQSVGMIPVHCHELGVDFYAASPHKWVQSPKGTGLAHISKKVQEVLRPMWVTWGQGRFEGTVRMFEDYGTRNTPEILSLGDSVDFQNALGMETRQARYRKLWKRFREEVESDPRLVWRSPNSWEQGGSLYAIEAKGFRSTELSDKLYASHGIVVRPFNTDALNTMRISPNLECTDNDIDVFFRELRRLI